VLGRRPNSLECGFIRVSKENQRSAAEASEVGCFFFLGFPINPGYILFRTCHRRRETASQITVELVSTSPGLWFTRNRLTSKAKTKSPRPLVRHLRHQLPPLFYRARTRDVGNAGGSRGPAVV
jgi:hypothetical protein